MFGKSKQKAQEFGKEAEDYRRKAAEAGRKADKLRKGLKASSDPAADRYMIRIHERDQGIAAANAWDYEDMAERAK